MTNFKDIAGKERGLLKINDKPMMEYVLESVPDEVDDIVIAVKGEKEAEAYGDIAEKYLARLYISSSDMASDLANLMAESGERNVLVIPCDAPLLKLEFTTFLLDVCKKFSAGIPRLGASTCYYLFSSYRSSEFLKAYNKSGKKNMEDTVSNMHNVLYINLNALKVFDEKLYMLLRVTSLEDAKRAERILRRLGQ